MRTFLIAAAAAVLAAPAGATVVDFTNVKATWINPVGGSGIVYSGNGTQNASIRWGTPSGQPQKSGYNFTASSLSFTVDPPSASAVGTLGTFTHFNFPISSGTGISALQLEFNTDILLDGVFYDNVSFIYDFDHWETPNQSNPCANGGPNNQGVNVNGCADRVRTTFNEQSSGFTISKDGVDYLYALDVIGFLNNGQPVTEFWTVENKTNVAEIRAMVRLYSEIGTGVPEPATWAMLIAGFGLVGVASRRRGIARTAA